jgi:hypothetical protein
MKILPNLVQSAILFGASVQSLVTAFSAPGNSLQALVNTHQKDIDALKEIASAISTNEAIAPASDVFYLRYILDDSYEDQEARAAALKSNLAWRMNEGNKIVMSAHNAIELAMQDGKWNNIPVQNAAPHASRINEFLKTPQAITTTLPTTNDLVYCIRAGKIDDKALMSSVSVDEMVDFFLYTKEVNNRVADIRSKETDSLIKVITVNDLKGVKVIGGSKDFRSSLSAATKKATELYPSLNGRSLLVNPPALLSALIKLFQPLFPKKVMDRIRFESGPLKDVEDLLEVVDGGSGRAEFVEQVQTLAYD